MTTEKQGIKYDIGKPAFDLIDPDWELDVARVLTFGATKYEPYNWARGMSLGKALAAVKRHINSIERGEHYDEECNTQHAANASVGLMFVHYFIRKGMLNIPDDRFNGTHRGDVGRRGRGQAAVMYRGRRRPKPMARKVRGKPHKGLPAGTQGRSQSNE